jgi:hypothetical protein
MLITLFCAVVTLSLCTESKHMCVVAHIRICNQEMTKLLRVLNMSISDATKDNAVNETL